MKYKYKNISKRKFLNPSDSHNNGSLKYYLDVTENTEHDTYSLEGGFILFDCRRSVELSLYGDTEGREGKKGLKQSIRKLKYLSQYANECADIMQKYLDGEVD